MKKNFTFYDLIVKKRLLGLLFLLLLCNTNFAQTFCRPASHTSGIGGVCLGTTEINNPTFAYDSSLSSYATLTNALGVLCFAQETLTFGQTAKAGDQIVVYYGSDTALLDVGLLSNSSIQAKNSIAGTSGPVVALNSPLLNIQVLPGNTTAVIRYTLTADANQVTIQVGGLVSLLSNLRVYDVRLQFANPTVAGGTTQSVCTGQSIALSATAATGTTIAWYDSPTSTTALSNVGTYTTPALTATTTYYVSTSRNTGCESDQRLPVTINVIEPVLPTISSTGTAICSTGATQATTLSVINPVLGTTYSWYNVPTGGVALVTGNTYTPTVPTGVTNFYVEASIGACKTPTRTAVSVTSTPVPGLATILTQSVSILSGQNATLSASTAEAGVTLDWYDVPTGGTKLLGDSNTFTTPILTATKTYYVESRNSAGGCVSATRVPVTVTVLANPLGGCLEANSQQTTQNGLCLLCSSTTPNNSVDGNSTTAARLSLPVGLVNGWIQQTLQFNNPGKAGDIVDVQLALPGGIADLSLLGAVSLATYNGATYNNDRIFINNSLVTLQLLSGNIFKASIVAGANFDRVEIRLGGVVTALTNLDIYQATYRYKAPTITGNTTICGGQTATLVSSAALGETIKWYDALTGGTLLSSTATLTTPVLTATTTYYVEVTRNGCVNSERNPVVVTVNNPVAPATVSVVPLNLCSGESTTLTIESPVAGTDYKWYDAATGGTLLFTGTSYATPSLTVPTTYYVEAGIGTCSSATRTPVSVPVNPRPAAPVPVSSSVVIQSGQAVTLSVTSAAGFSYYWYDAPTGGNLLASNTSTYTPSPALTANKTFYVEARASSTDCTSDTRAVITVMVINTVSTCLQPNSQVTTTDGLLCALCTSTNPNNSVDGNINTFASLFTPVAAAGAYIQQQLTFPTPGQAGDIIEVDLELPAGLADVSLLGGGISLATYNGATYNNDRFLLNSGLLNLQLLSGNKFKATFTATAAFNKVEIRIGGGAATLLTTLNIYEASYRFPNATITGATAPICAGGTAALAASSTGTETFTWYDAPVGGNLVAVSPTLPLSATTTYYLEATRGGTCINSVRQPVTITVLPIPTAADITIASPVTASCAGDIVLTPTSALAGATFKYYTDQNKTQEITTGTIAGVSYSKDATTGALTISGLVAANAPYNYYVSVLNGGTCENVNGTLKQVVVDYPAASALAVTTPFAGCAKVNLKDAITNFDTSGNTTYSFFDSSNNPITDQVAANILVSGNYFIQAQTTGVACPSVKLPVAVTVNPLPTLTGVTNSIAVNIGASVALTATSNGTITWYDPQGNVLASNNTGPLNTVGVFTYTVIASNGTCTTSQTVTISVIDPAACDSLLERVYANSQLSGSVITGSVTNGPLAVDSDPATFSTITTGLGLLGIGTTWQNLQWPTTIPKGTPVTVKLGLENSLIAVGQSISVIGTKRDGSNNPIDIGTLQSVSGSLLNLLPGQNSFEYTFVPSNTAGLQDYDGIRVQLGSVLSVAQNINVYDAYYKKQVTQIACGQGDIEDIFSGVKDLGVGALTATVGVSNPWNVADGDVATYATMFSGAGVLAAAELTTTFRTPSMVGDSLRITISKPGTILNLNLLTGFTIQLYSGNIAVGAPIQNTSSLLTLKLLSGDTMAMTIVAPQTEPYDKVVITFGGVASVLDQLRVHTIDRVTNTKVIGGDPDNEVTVCPGTDITLQVPPKSCANYAWYDSPTGGNLLASGQTYTLPATLAAGTYKYYIQPIRYGCPALERGEVTVVVRATTPAAAIANVTINGGNNTIICAEDGNVTLDAILNGTPVLTNPVYHWYSFDGTTSQLIPGEITSKLVLTGLVPGTYTYYVGVSSDEYCETLAADRKQVTFTILPTSLSTDIVVDNASVCHDTDATLTPTSALSNPVFFWYLDANKTQPVTNGAVINGVTYAVSGTGALTASGLTTAMSPISYYVAVTSDFTCPNKNGELKVATVIVNDPATPTSTTYTQDFCLVNNPTVANLQANEANVVWYTSATGGTALDPITALVNGTYYGAIKDPSGCESSVRSVVTVTVTDPGTPTLVTGGTQNFCLVDAPTFASVQFNQTNIVWYTALTGGTAIAATTPLTSGTYFAALKDATTNCESATRLSVTISVTDPGTPTLVTAGTQNFCLVDAPTFASVQFNETNIVWYTALTGGTAIAATTPLTSGTYFAALKDATTNCESATRLSVTISVTDPGTPTLVTGGTQNFCLVDGPTFASVQFNETNIVWYTALTGGTAILSTTTLTSGTYFAALKDATTNCESSVRLSVTINVTDPGTPTLVTAGTQNFCLADAPTFASVQFNQANIVWYTALTGGTAIPVTTPLTSGTYFAALKDATTNCESATRLSVTISVTDPGTPTLVTAGTQNFCLADVPTFASVQFNQANIVWYTALTGGTAIPSTTPLTNGTYFATIKDPTTNCESTARLSVTINVVDPGTPTLVTAGTQNFCLVDTPTFASVQFNQANIVWYTALTGGTVIPSTTALTSGTYFAVIKDPTSGCESVERLQVTISVTDPGTPTLVTAGTQNFCLVNAPTFASVQFNQANIVWYTALTGGTAIPATTPLTSGTYFAALKDATTNCESAERLSVTINVSDPGTPTLVTAGTQNFCLANVPTFASVQFNQANIVWYTALAGGTAIPSTTPLTNGTYFAVIKDPVSGCESTTRLSVTINVIDPGTPTLVTAGTQNFCLVNAPTFANVQFNQANIVWYTALTGGTVIPSTTALTSGTYFAVIKDPASGCESVERLQVTISVTDPGTPTTTLAAQTFCSENNSTVANIQVNESNVVWYSAATGGTAIAPTTALVNGDYFAALKDATTGCESSIRLKVTVTIGSSNTPTTNNAAQNFCSNSAPTFASIQVNESNVSWFSTATGGTAIPLTTALASGTYYGEITNPVTGCKSSTRLQVVITIVNPMATPTTSSATQNFCSVNTPTVSNIQVNESNVIWYSTPTGGTAIPATTALATGTYYGVVSSGSGCENAVRLAVVVNVNTPIIITTPKTTQTFCLSAVPTIANIVVNETNVVWYSSATGGTPLAANTPLTATTYYAGALSNTINGCDNATRLGVTIAFENDALVPITTTDDTPCVFQGITYSVANGKSDYVWSITNGTITSGGGNADGSVTVSWSDIGPGKVEVKYTNTCNETTTKSLNVTVATCSDLTITNTVSNPTPNFGDQITFTVTVNNVGQGNFINTIVSELLPSGYNLVSASTTAGIYDLQTQLWTIPTLNAGQSVVLTVVAEVLPSGNYLNVATVEISTPLDLDASNNSASAVVEPICLTVYNEFTPNNDGANDLFRIDCIESYPNNELKVYNRYGSLVYSKQHYENDWDGTANVSGVINRGDMLPTGTYFYVITIGDGTVKKGWLSIMR